MSINSSKNSQNNILRFSYFIFKKWVNYVLNNSSITLASACKCLPHIFTSITLYK